MLLVHGERRLAPSYDSGAPAEASAKSGDGDEVAGLDLALAHRRVERQRDGARARVAVLVQIGDHLLHRDAQLLRHSLHDANIRLVQQQPIYLVSCHLSGLHRLRKHLRDHGRGELVDFLPVHGDWRIGSSCHLRDGREVLLGAGVLEVEVAPARAIGVHLEAEHAALGVRLRRAHHHRARTVAKEHARVAVAPVHPPRERVSANHHRRLVSSIVKKL
mmetsp:Transcript_30882/g.67636  ORF Transcript_30882/g.67636 Transcript_30882/m.67636 type:complete len:218 (-) Transcript_30882:548-1201(-)